jgi:hypothetical protein
LLFAPFCWRYRTTDSYFNALAASSAVRPSVFAALTVDALLDDELHRFEHQRFPIAAFGLDPRRPAAHADRCHQRGGHVLAMLKAGAASALRRRDRRDARRVNRRRARRESA